MPQVLSTTWNYSAANSRLRVILTLDTMPSSSVYKGDYVEKGSLEIVNGFPYWTQNNTQKTITFNFDWNAPINDSLDRIFIEMPYESTDIRKSLKIEIENQNGSPVIVSQELHQLWQLDFSASPFNGDYDFTQPSGIFYTDETYEDFSEEKFLMVYYASNIVNFFAGDKTPEKLYIVHEEKQHLFTLHETNPIRYEITESFDPKELLINLNQEIDFEETYFEGILYLLDENGNVVETKNVGLYEEIDDGLIEQISLTEIKFFYWENYSNLTDNIVFEFEEYETIRYQKQDTQYILLEHKGPFHRNAFIITPTNGYVWDVENPIYIEMKKENGEIVSGYLNDDPDPSNEFFANIEDGIIEWYYRDIEKYPEITFLIPSVDGSDPEEQVYVVRDGQYQKDEDIPDKTEVWEEKIKDGSQLPHTTSNYVLDGDTAKIVIRSDTAISNNFTWWRYPESGFSEDIIYKVPNVIEMNESNTKAFLQITPYPKGEFYIENGDFTKLYDFVDPDDENVDIQFSKERIQLIANSSIYSFKKSSPILKLYKVENGKTEVVPTVMFVGTQNSVRYKNNQGQTSSLGVTNFDFVIWGVYKDKTFAPGMYYFEFNNLEFLKPYTMKKGFKDIIYYGPNGVADGYHTGEDFYEVV